MGIEAVRAAAEEMTQDERTKAAVELLGGRGLNLPTPTTNDKIWITLVVTLAVALLGTIAAVCLFIYTDHETDVVAPFVTFILGLFGGLLAPSPVNGKAKDQGSAPA